MEIAYVSSNKIYLEIEKKQGGILSEILAKLTEKPSKFIATMLVGNNVSLVVYGFFMGEMVKNWLENLGWSFSGIIEIVIQTSISTLIVLITSEFFRERFSFKYMPIPS